MILFTDWWLQYQNDYTDRWWSLCLRGLSSERRNYTKVNAENAECKKLITVLEAAIELEAADWDSLRYSKLIG